MGYVTKKLICGWRKHLLWLTVGIFFVASPLGAIAQEHKNTDTLLMTLTPPLYQLSLAPGATWSSNLRFRNGNAYPLTMYVSVQNFRAKEDSGVELYPRTVGASSSPHELALWVKAPADAFIVPAGETENIPFDVTVPSDAEPGGHYAAIIVSTTPPASDAMLSVSSGLSALLLVRVSGDVHEEGSILDFATEHFITQSQEALFHLQFENTGNVHIEPSGDIDITNMFGRTRGHVRMDQSHAFGNILPRSTKTFSFDWKGEKNFFDIGLYHARARLVYGENKEKTAYYSTYFLVFPWVPATLILGFIFGFAWFIRRSVRRYVATAVRIDEKNKGIEARGSVGRMGAKSQITLAMLREPISGRSRSKNRQSFIAFLVIVLLGLMLIDFYFYQVFQSERQYQVTTTKDPKSPF